MKIVRSSDTVARLGGTFVVLLSDMSDSGMVEAVARNIVKDLALPIAFEGHEMLVSAIAVTALARDISKLPSTGTEQDS